MQRSFIITLYIRSIESTQAMGSKLDEGTSWDSQCTGHFGNQSGLFNWHLIKCDVN